MHSPAQRQAQAGAPKNKFLSVSVKRLRATLARERWPGVASPENENADTPAQWLVRPSLFLGRSSLRGDLQPCRSLKSQVSTAQLLARRFQGLGKVIVSVGEHLLEIFVNS
jgi:hypothetical protein